MFISISNIKRENFAIGENPLSLVFYTYIYNINTYKIIRDLSDYLIRQQQWINCLWEMRLSLLWLMSVQSPFHWWGHSGCCSFLSQAHVLYLELSFHWSSDIFKVLASVWKCCAAVQRKCFWQICFKNLPLHPHWKCIFCFALISTI